jgi:hypothetical protein
MQISGLSPTVTTRSYEREQDSSATARDRHQQRSSFSKAHVIIDLSIEAQQQIGHETISTGRRTQAPLFIYNQAGAFAYSEPSRPDKPTVFVENNVLVEELSVIEPPIPRSVMFDGRLGA